MDLVPLIKILSLPIIKSRFYTNLTFNHRTATFLVELERPSISDFKVNDYICVGGDAKNLADFVTSFDSSILHHITSVIDIKDSKLICDSEAERFMTIANNKLLYHYIKEKPFTTGHKLWFKLRLLQYEN